MDNQLINNQAIEAIQKRNKDYEQAIFVFLKERGYKPKLTPKYFKALQKRLKKKGKELKINIYPLVTFSNGDKIIQRYNIKVSIDDMEVM